MIIFTEMNRNNIYYLTNEKIINLVNNYKNYILYNNLYYYYYEYKNFKDYFIQYRYEYNNLDRIKYYNYFHESHREDGPALIYYKHNGEISYKGYYYLNGTEYSYEEYLLKIKKV